LTELALATRCAAILDEIKAENIVILEIGKLTELADFFVIATCRNTRHSASAGEKLRVTLKEDGILPIGIEGFGQPNWVLLDYASVVVHIFENEYREFYGLDHLWADAPKIPLVQEAAP